MLPLIAVAGCGGAAAGSERGLSYGANAQRSYEEAMRDFEDENCQEAEGQFRKIRREFPYSRFAALSELRVADCYGIQNKFVEAVQAFKQFIRFRPSHAEVPYARFKIAEAYYNEIPSGWFLSPPSHELDQSATRDAVNELRKFLEEYPEDTHVADARRMQTEAITMLARHELYVAEYYLDMDKPRAAVGRLQTAVTAYPGSSVESEALVLLGRTQLHLGDRRAARRVFEELRESQAGTGYAEQAAEFLEEMGPVSPDETRQVEAEAAEDAANAAREAAEPSQTVAPEELPAEDAESAAPSAPEPEESE